MQLALTGVTFAYPSAPEPLITNATVVFPVGWIGLLGDNGCGKSTLVNLACGILPPDSGSVTSGLFCAVCAQDASTPPAELADFALDYGHDALELRRIFHIDDDMPWRFDALSFGERKKLQIACALWKRPDVLAVDEPTNHLDQDARAQLTEALKRFRGIGILVSHDRALLDALVDRCVSFEPGGALTVRPGGYTKAHGQLELERETARRERAEAKTELARLQAEQDRRAHEAARSKARRSKRHIDPKDKSAKAKIDLAVYTGQDGVAGKLSARMDTRIAAAHDRVAASFVHKRLSALTPAERGTVLSTVAHLNSKPGRILEGEDVSPGEMRKLMLAAGILRNPVLVIMDEPTNHLDLHSVEALERALAAYPDALLLVSHDRAFLAACTHAVWEVRDGRVTVR